MLNSLDHQEMQIHSCKFQISIIQATVQIKFPCKLFVEWKDYRKKRSWGIEDQELSGSLLAHTQTDNVIIQNGIAHFDETIETQALYVRYDVGKKSYPIHTTWLNLMLVSKRKPDQSKLVGRIQLNLSEILNDTLHSEPIIRYLQFCSVKGACLKFSVKLLNNQPTNLKIVSIQNQQISSWRSFDGSNEKLGESSKQDTQKIIRKSVSTSKIDNKSRQNNEQTQKLNDQAESEILKELDKVVDNKLQNLKEQIQSKKNQNIELQSKLREAEATIAHLQHLIKEKCEISQSQSVRESQIKGNEQYTQNLENKLQRLNEECSNYKHQVIHLQKQLESVKINLIENEKVNLQMQADSELYKQKVQELMAKLQSQDQQPEVIVDTNDKIVELKRQLEQNNLAMEALIGDNTKLRDQLQCLSSQKMIKEIGNGIKDEIEGKIENEEQKKADGQKCQLKIRNIQQATVKENQILHNPQDGREQERSNNPQKVETTQDAYLVGNQQVKASITEHKNELFSSPQKQINEMIQLLSDKEKQIDSAKSTIKSIEAHKQQLQSAFIILKQQIIDKDTFIRLLSHNQQEQKVLHKQLQEDFQRIRAQLQSRDNTEQIVKDFQKQIERLKTQKEEQGSQIQKVKEQLNIHKQQAQTVLEERKNLTNQLEELRKQLDNLKTVLTQYQQSNKQGLASNKQLEQYNNQLITQLQEKQQQLKIIKQQYQLFTNQQSLPQSLPAQPQASAVTQTLKQTIKQLQNDKDKLLQELKEREEQIKRVSDQNMAHQQQIKKVYEQSSAQERLLEIQAQQIQESDQANQKVIEGYERRIQQLKQNAQLQVLHQTIKLQEQQLQQLKQNKQQRNGHQPEQQKMENSKPIYNVDSQQVKESQQIVNNKEAQANQQAASWKQLNQKLSQKEQELINLNEQMANMQAGEKQAFDKNAQYMVNLENEIGQYQQQLGMMQGKFEESEQMRLETQAQNLEIKYELSELKAELLNKDQQISQFKATIESASKKIEQNMNPDLQLKISEFQQLNVSLLQEIKSLESDMKNLSAKNQQLGQINRKLEDQLTATATANNSQNSQLQQLYLSMKKQQDQYKQSLITIKQQHSYQLEQKESEVQNLRAERQQLSKKIEEKIKVDEEKIAELESMLQEIQGRESVTRIEDQQKNQLIQSLNQQIENQIKQYQDLQMKYSNLLERNIRLSRYVCSIEEQGQKIYQSYLELQTLNDQNHQNLTLFHQLAGEAEDNKINGLTDLIAQKDEQILKLTNQLNHCQFTISELQNNQRDSGKPGKILIDQFFKDIKGLLKERQDLSSQIKNKLQQYNAGDNAVGPSVENGQRIREGLLKLRGTVLKLEISRQTQQEFLKQIKEVEKQIEAMREKTMLI